MRLPIESVLEATSGKVVWPEASLRPIQVRGVSTDTRTLRPGDLFVPLRGPRFDGHAFIGEAFRRGAVASLCARRIDGLPDDALLIQVPDPLRALGQIAHLHRRQLAVTVVGVTGSVGKTTTTKMCATVLGTQFRVAQSQEEWNAEIGVPLTLVGLREDDQIAVIEMAMRGLGQIADLVAIAEPAIGVVTAIGEAHLEMLGSRENIARAKGELVAGLPEAGTAVLNADDPDVAALTSLCRGRILTYGLIGPADITAEAIHHDDVGTSFRISARRRWTTVRVAAWGRHNVGNALAATAVGLTLGMDLDAMREGLARYTPPTMRLEPVIIKEALVINDAYNASPSSMRAAFEVLQAVGHGRRLVAVLGEMKELGPESTAMHRHIGRDVAARGVVMLITVGDGGANIAEGAAEAGMDSAGIHRTLTVDEAAQTLRALLRPGDVVLVKGSRALKMERIVEMLQRES